MFCRFLFFSYESGLMGHTLKDGNNSSIALMCSNGKERSSFPPREQLCFLFPATNGCGTVRDLGGSNLAPAPFVSPRLFSFCTLPHYMLLCQQATFNWSSIHRIIDPILNTTHCTGRCMHNCRYCDSIRKESCTNHDRGKYNKCIGKLK